MEAAEPIVGRRRVRQFGTTQEKRFIVEETRKTGVSVATVAQAHGVNANQVFTGASCMRRDSLRAQLRSRPGILERVLCGYCLSASTKVRNAKPRVRRQQALRITQQGVMLCRARSS